MKLEVMMCLASIAYCCGIAVHLELVERLIPLLPERLARHEKYIRSGAFYPDAFYDCRGQYNVAEDAHWPPFLGKGVELVQERKSQGKDTSQLEAFLIGILSHQVSDVSWHSLGIFQGLLRAMAEREFDGDYDKAHTVLDVGGDMVQISRRSSKPLKGVTWDYNVDDIKELAARAGYKDIPKSSIHYCMSRGRAAFNGELKVASIAHKHFSRKSPTMFNELETYFTGGITDMHEQIEECLPQLVRWLDSGTSTNDYWDICPVFAGMKRDENDEMDGPNNHIHQNTFDMVQETLDEVVDDSKEKMLVKRGLAGELLTDILHDSIPEMKKKLTGAHKIIKCVPTVEFKCTIIPAPGTSSRHSIATNSHPQFGSSVSFWDDLLIISSPGENKVYVYDQYGKDIKYVISSPHKAKKWGEYSAHFGTTTVTWGDYLIISCPGISTLDIFNKSGDWCGGFIWPNATRNYGQYGRKMIGQAMASTKSHIYVGAPYADSDSTLEQAGIVYAISKELLSKTIDSQKYMELDLKDNILVAGSFAYQRVGTIISTTQRQVLVGSPGSEEVYVYDDCETIVLKSSVLSVKSGFGGHFIAANEKFIVVGAPAGSLKDYNDQNGVIEVFTSDSQFLISVDGDFEWFGSYGVLKDSYMYIASPHAKSGKGMLWKVDLVSKTVSEMGNAPQSFASNFGSSIAYSNSILAIGMPQMQKKSGKRGGVAIINI